MESIIWQIVAGTAYIDFLEEKEDTDGRGKSTVRCLCEWRGLKSLLERSEQ